MEFIGQDEVLFILIDFNGHFSLKEPMICGLLEAGRTFCFQIIFRHSCFLFPLKFASTK